MLTRHLYREDEVRASLRYCLLWKRHSEACFWALELLDSHLLTEVLSDCMWACFYGLGQPVFDTVRAKEEITDDDLLGLVSQIIMTKRRDASVGWLLERGLTETQMDWLVPDKRVVAGDPIASAFAQGKVLLAWCLLRTRWETDAQKYLDPFEEIEGFVWESRALAVLQRGKPTLPRGTTEIPAYLQKEIQGWKELEGRRARRVYSIRTDPILFGTRRSLTADSVCLVPELHDLETALRGSTYWELVAEDMGGWSKIQKKDATREAFYELYFPDDIPDEWSRAEKEKSHRWGLLANTSTPEIQHAKHLRSVFRGLPTQGLQSWTVLKRESTEDYSVLYARGQERWSTLQWKLTPTKKRLVPK